MRTPEDICKSLDMFSGICSLSSKNFGFVIGTIITVILILAVFIAVFYLIYGGIKWILSRGDKEHVESARSHIVAAVVGLVIVFLSFFAINVVFGFFFPGQSIQDLKLPTLTPDTQPPIVSIISPTHQSTVLGTVPILVNAKDNEKVVKVEFLIDGAVLNTDETEPYEYNWDTKSYKHNSSHTLLAKAYDENDNIGTSATTNVVIADTTKPIVSIANLTNGANVSQNSTVSILATTSDVSGIAQVEFRINGVLKCTDLSVPYSCLWQVTGVKGVIHRIEVASYDTAGNMANTSINVSVQ